ncbi:hypothetical protein [Actinoplanes sp. NPDC051851]|uniref:hypothetical protein n=1 Tax=Actinoplanes sp. NPDC051851 TaxID=3154753 RepID=UPI003432A969
MGTVHQLICTISPGGLLFTCEDDGCGRRLAVTDDGELVIIDHGDRAVLHRGSSGGIEVTTGVRSL